MLKRFLAAFAVVMVMALGFAVPASARPIPPPSGSDVTSLGVWGDANMGGSVGKDGFSYTFGGTKVTSSGYPISRTTIVGPMGNYDATTDYGYENGGIEHWSSYKSPMVDFFNWFSYTPAEGYKQWADVRFGMMKLHCEQHICKMV